MNCPKCKSIVSKLDKACPVCGEALQSQPKPQQQTTVKAVKNNTPKQRNNQVFTPKQKNTANPPLQNTANVPLQNTQNTPAQQTSPTDNKSSLLNLFCFMFPIVGYVYFFFCRTYTPIRAKSALKASVANTVISFVSALILTFVSHS